MGERISQNTNKNYDPIDEVRLNLQTQSAVDQGDSVPFQSVFYQSDSVLAASAASASSAASLIQMASIRELTCSYTALSRNLKTSLVHSSESSGCCKISSTAGSKSAKSSASPAA